jgi:hypothetical protein
MPVEYLQAGSLKARSSVGEHYLDAVGVSGSIPLVPTISEHRICEMKPKRLWGVSCEIHQLYRITRLCLPVSHVLTHENYCQTVRRCAGYGRELYD